jgi:hypothetical protein
MTLRFVVRFLALLSSFYSGTGTVRVVVTAKMNLAEQKCYDDTSVCGSLRSFSFYSGLGLHARHYACRSCAVRAVISLIADWRQEPGYVITFSTSMRFFVLLLDSKFPRNYSTVVRSPIYSSWLLQLSYDYDLTTFT